MSDLFIASKAVEHDGSRRAVADGWLQVRPKAAADFGSCWCHAKFDLTAPANSFDQLCATCRGRSPSACQNAHKKETAS